MSKELRLKEAIENTEANIIYLAGLPDKELSNRLDLVHIQMELAEQKRNTDSLELFFIITQQARPFQMMAENAHDYFSFHHQCFLP
jgi:hypothetical protein